MNPINFAVDLENLIHQCQPRSILYLGKEIDDVTRHYQDQASLLKNNCEISHAQDIDELNKFNDRFDMGIIIGALDSLPKQDTLPVLARFRDLLTKRFFLSIKVLDNPDSTHDWKANDFFGLGFSLINRYQNSTTLESSTEPKSHIHIYRFDINTYKTTPRWLNPDDWANPELWNKYRW